MLRHFINKKDIFLPLVIFITFLVPLILTICQCIKKVINTLALATYLPIVFIEEYYKQHRFNIEKNLYQKISKIVSNNPLNNPHQPLHPMTPQQRQHLVKQVNPNPLHEFHFKKLPKHFKKDTHHYPNLKNQLFAKHPSVKNNTNQHLTSIPHFKKISADLDNEAKPII